MVVFLNRVRPTIAKLERGITTGWESLRLWGWGKGRADAPNENPLLLTYNIIHNNPMNMQIVL